LPRPEGVEPDTIDAINYLGYTFIMNKYAREWLNRKVSWLQRRTGKKGYTYNLYSNEKFSSRLNLTSEEVHEMISFKPEPEEYSTTRVKDWVNAMGFDLKWTGLGTSVLKQITLPVPQALKNPMQDIEAVAIHEIAHLTRNLDVRRSLESHGDVRYEECVANLTMWWFMDQGHLTSSRGFKKTLLYEKLVKDFHKIEEANKPFLIDETISSIECLTERLFNAKSE